MPKQVICKLPVIKARIKDTNVKASMRVLSKTSPRHESIEPRGNQEQELV
jgi:hypothetical protein